MPRTSPATAPPDRPPLLLVLLERGTADSGGAGAVNEGQAGSPDVPHRLGLPATLDEGGAGNEESDGTEESVREGQWPKSNQGGISLL